MKGLKGRHRTAQGNALGFEAIIAIQRCKRATILLLTRRPSNIVARASQPAVGKPSFGSQVSKPACRGFSTTHSNVFALLFANQGGPGHWPVPSGDPPDGTGEALFLPADTMRHWGFVILPSFNPRPSSFPTETIVNPRNNTFYILKTAMNTPQECPPSTLPIWHWCLVILSSFSIRHSSFLNRNPSKIPEISLFTL